MKVIGYTYDAAMHCPECTLKYAHEIEYKDYIFGEYSDEDIQSSPGIIDVEKAIELEIIRDSENNPIHPIFSTDEAGDTPDHCDDCGAFIDNSWNGETVGYAIDSLWNYVQATVNGEKEKSSREVLDEWLENMQFMMVDSRDDLVMELYKKVREWEGE